MPSRLIKVGFKILTGIFGLALLLGVVTTPAQAENRSTAPAVQEFAASGANYKSASFGYAPSSVNLSPVVVTPKALASGNIWWWQKLRHNRWSERTSIVVNDIRYCGGAFRIDRGAWEQRRLIFAIQVPKNTRLWKFGLFSWKPMTAKKPYTWCLKAPAGQYFSGEWAVRNGNQWGNG